MRYDNSRYYRLYFDLSTEQWMGEQLSEENNWTNVLEKLVDRGV